ncbi:MAG: hypothetical protein KAJ52_09030 [Sedimentisphaerales bacterium]|nr:hypothetical protein [Sedimentisphaerales bacterium]
MKNLKWFVLLIMLFCSLSLTPVVAEVRLPAIISDNMVLQQGPGAPLWGWADPGEKVTVSGNWQSKPWRTTADSNGKWQVRIDSPKNGGPYVITVTGENTITIKNVICGEVWVCSGQSNMGMRVGGTNNSKQEIAAADYPDIRLFAVARKVADQPQDDCRGRWSICSPETIAGFSATAYFFGRELHQKLHVPVGLIGASWGGSPVGAWTRHQILEADQDFVPIIERYKQAVIDYPENMEKYKQQLEQWKEDVEKAKAEEEKPPRQPRTPFGPGHRNSPAGLYNGMIVPLIPLAIRGVIWYQGEANTRRAWQYRKLFPAMIRSWRQDWGRGDFPFLYAQIAPFQGYGKGGRVCPELQEAQSMALSLPNTGMAVTTDIGNIEDIHPRNKQDVGKRLALWAFSKAYGQSLVYSGPLYKSMQVEGDKIRLFFDHVAGGLVARGGPLTFFTIAGEDEQFVPAQAVIDGETIVVSSDQVPTPVAVRFAWINEAEPNLFNKAALPASPFRTDDWLCTTFDRR